MDTHLHETDHQNHNGDEREQMRPPEPLAMSNATPPLRRSGMLVMPEDILGHGLLQGHRAVWFGICSQGWGV
jgi:hypothetical protein